MLRGSIVAIVTPMKVEDTSIDYEILGELIDWHINEGTKGIVIVGTTGESPTVSFNEHCELIEFAVKASKGRVPVIAGTGANSTQEAIDLSVYSKDVGADFGLSVVPYYNKPTQAGLIKHFTELHDQCELPIVIYNIPGRSSIDMIPETMGHLAKLPRVIGVKDATGDLARVCAQRITCGTDFLQISGEDATAHGFNAQGGVGCISVTANVAPKLSAQLQAATLAGDYDKALELQDKLMPLHHAIFTEPGLVGVKYAMSLLGLCSDEVRLPLIPLSNETKKLIKSAIQSAGLT